MVNLILFLLICYVYNMAKSVSVLFTTTSIDSIDNKDHKYCQQQMLFLQEIFLQSHSPGVTDKLLLFYFPQLLEVSTAINTKYKTAEFTKQLSPTPHLSPHPLNNHFPFRIQFKTLEMHKSGMFSVQIHRPVTRSVRLTTV